MKYLQIEARDGRTSIKGSTLFQVACQASIDGDDAVLMKHGKHHTIVCVRHEALMAECDKQNKIPKTPSDFERIENEPFGITRCGKVIARSDSWIFNAHSGFWLNQNLEIEDEPEPIVH